MRTEAVARVRSLALPSVLRLPLGALAALSLLGFVVLALRYAGSGASGRIDRWLLDALGGTQFAPSPTHTFALLIDRCGEPDGATILVTVVAVVCFARRQGRLGLLALVGPGVTVLASTALKPVIGRTVPAGSLAFPSGHTAFLTAWALVFALLVVEMLDLGRMLGSLVVIGIAGAAGAAMSWSQTVLFSHYPTDAVGGFLLAVVVVQVVAWAIDVSAQRVPSP